MGVHFIPIKMKNFVKADLFDRPGSRLILNREFENIITAVMTGNIKVHAAAHHFVKIHICCQNAFLVIQGTSQDGAIGRNNYTAAS